MDASGFLLVVLATAVVCATALMFTSRRAAAAGSDAVHPVYPVTPSDERVERARGRVAPMMEMSETDMVALVPDKTGFLFMGCPDCDEGTQEGQLDWSIEDPHRVRCKFCGMVYPNETYPESGTLRFTNPVGQEAEYGYWEDETGYRLFFSARAWRHARTYFAQASRDLALLYQMTGDRAYARRAVLILDAFARYYPGFLVSEDWPHRPKGFCLEPPYPFGGGKWGRWRGDEMPTDCIQAYDWVFDSGELEQLSEETGTDVARRIEEDFFRGAVRQDDYHGPAYHNASPRIYEGYAVMGRVLGDPGLVHEAVRRSRGMFERRFFEDGFWCEGSVGYHRMTMRGMDHVFEALRGYSDPDGYVDPEDDDHFQDLDVERDIAIMGRAVRIPALCRYPEGRTIPVHDNRARSSRDPSSPPRGSVLLPGVGHAWLGCGMGSDAVQAHLHFSGAYGHEHADALDTILFAKGKELLPDLGYTHTRYRTWTTGTLGHNTVMIDEQRQYTRGGGGDADGCLAAFEVAYPQVQWLEAGGERTYPGVAEEYRRALVLVDAGGGEAYVVDLFRVTGGSCHDWVMHGSADEDSDAQVNIPVTAYGPNLLKDVKVTLPTGEADRGDAEGRNTSYAFFQNVSRGDVPDKVEMTLSLRESDVAVRTHLNAGAGGAAFVGDAPSIRRAQENDVLLDRFRMPIFMLRREGPAPLRSRFAAVHEPFSGAPFVDGVDVEHLDGDGDAIVIRVRHHGVTDHIVHRGGAEPGRTTSGEISLEGELGFIREREGALVSMGLWGGTELRFGNRVLSAEGPLKGTVVDVLRKSEGAAYDGLVVEDPLRTGGTLEGGLALVSFGDGTTRGYRLQGAEQSEGQTHLALVDEPGFAVTEDGARHVFFPAREMAGPVSVRIRTSALVDLSHGTARITAVGGASFAGE